MKIVIALLALAAVAQAQVQYNRYNQYNPYNRYNAYDQYNPAYNQYNQYNPAYNQYNPYNKYNPGSNQYNPYNNAYYNNLNTGKQWAILRQSQDSGPDGSYAFSYDTENGISVAEEGRPVNLGPAGQTEVVRGQYSYTSPDGTPIQVSYTADENGFQPQGAHLPTPPPIPEAIQRSLAYNAAHPEQDRK